MPRNPDSGAQRRRSAAVVAVALVLAAAGGAAVWDRENRRATAQVGHGGTAVAVTAPPEMTTPPTSSATSPAASTVTTSSDRRTPADVAAGLLSLDVPTDAGGDLVVVPGRSAAPGAGTVRTVRVEVEAGLPVDGAVLAQFVMTTLNDPRGWGAGGTMTFARTDGAADLRVVLASPTTVDRMCAPLSTEGAVSCAQHGYAALNVLRWVSGTPEFTDNLLTYRQYVVNHEVGHLLGHHHVTCPGAGQLAPVMQQQTYGVAPCVPNGWPHP